MNMPLRHGRDLVAFLRDPVLSAQREACFEVAVTQY
jgi:hypothetical protein